MKIVIISIFVTLISFVISLTNIFHFNWIKKIPLGIDLKGGQEILLQINLQNYLEDLYRNLAEDIKSKFKNSQKNSLLEIEVSEEGIIIYTQYPLDNTYKSELLKSLSADFKKELEISTNKSKNYIKISYKNSYRDQVVKNVLNQSQEVIINRIDASGLSEIVIQRKSQDKLLIQIPGDKNFLEIRSLLSQVAKLSLHLVKEDFDIKKFNPKINKDLKISHSIHEKDNSILVFKRPIFTGENIKMAKLDYTEYNVPVVAFSLDSYGSKIFAHVTSENIGSRIAILLDGKFITAPVINQPILGGNGIISSKNFSSSEAKELVNFIRSGSLPAKVSILEEKIIGPSLGSDYIEKGKHAVIISLILVVFIMIMFYSILGVLASFSLLLTINYIIALITLFNMTLSFASIAGIVLTIGMAVDANVLIYEKIKEELSHKNSIPYAIHMGFKSSFLSIWDSNVTTLFAMLCLYIFGKGPLQSFSISLSIGIISSMFSALIINKYLINVLMKLLQGSKILTKIRLV